jgi:glycosyltransferase involved in cell wall biosynthesis
VQRNLQLARHLHDLGFSPTVITGPAERDDFRWTPPDRILSDERLNAVVHRLGGPEPSPAAARRERWLRMKTPWERWWTTGVARFAMEAGAGVDVVHASLAPFRTANAALAVAQQLEKPLILDLEDPWALDDMLSYPTSMHRRLERRRMASTLAAADRVVMNTDEARERVLEAFPELDSDRVTAIPNAFDPMDFADPAPDESRDGRFRIVHTGSLHTDLGLAQQQARRLRRVFGGTIRDVDFLPRSHVYLLEATRSALTRKPELAGVVEVHLAGVFTREDRAVASRYPFVRLHEFLPHNETIRLMRSADLLFLPLYDLPPGRRAGIVPHKTYEYVASGRPILAAVPDGDARDLLERSGAATLCRPTDTAAMSDALIADVQRWITGLPSRAPRPEVVASCSAPRLLQEVAALYYELVGRRRQAVARVAVETRSVAST